MGTFFIHVYSNMNKRVHVVLFFVNAEFSTPETEVEVRKAKLREVALQ